LLSLPAAIARPLVEHIKRRLLYHQANYSAFVCAAPLADVCTDCLHSRFWLNAESTPARPTRPTSRPFESTTGTRLIRCIVI